MLRLLSRKAFLAALVALLLLAVAAAVYLGRSLPTDDLRPASDPTASYEEAMARFDGLRAAEDKLPLHEGGRTILLTHGHPTERVFVLLHGFTNAPRQFRELGEKLFAGGANVIIPRLTGHGFADRLTDAHGALAANDLIRYAENGIDIAHGLGNKITVVGLSVSGVTAAWLARSHADIDQVFLLAPFLGPPFVPDRLAPAVAGALVRLPNAFQWWDPRVRENLPGPPYNYPRFATRPLGEALRLGVAIDRQAGPLKVRRFGVVLTENDPAVSNARTLRMLADWKAASPGTEFFLHTFPASERVPHDFIDPLQPTAQTDRIYAQLAKWMLEQ